MIDPNPDMDNLEITFTAASPEPYERYDHDTGQTYFERLICTPEAVNLERLNGGASILKNHDTDHILGTIVRAWIEDEKVCIRGRFRKNDFAAVDTFRDIVDGTLKNVSIGYYPDASEDKMENGVLFRDLTRWTAFEVSVAVGVPADPTVGFYRSIDIKNRKEKEMAEESKDPESEVKACGTEAETKECAEPETEAKACQPEEGKAEDEKPAEVKADEPAAEEEPKAEEKEPEKQPEVRAADLKRAITPKEIKSFNNPKGISTMSENKKYSLTRAFQSLLNHDVDATYERNVSDELCRSMGMLPTRDSIMLSFREGEFIDAANNGAGLVGVEHRGDMFIEALRTRMGVKNARFITGLRMPISIPVQTGVSEIGIKALNASVDRTRPTVTNIEMRPKKFGAETVIGEDLLLQGNPDAIAIVVNDLQAEIARKLDITALKGDNDLQIAGVDGTTGVQTVTVADMNTITWKDVLAMYGKIADYELDEGSLEWIAKGTTKAMLMGIPKETHTGRFICDEDGTVNGYRLNVSGRCTDEDLYFGCWPYLYIGQWGGLQIKLDPYSGISNGSVKIVATMYADIAITRPAAFVKRVASGSN